MEVMLYAKDPSSVSIKEVMNAVDEILDATNVMEPQPVIMVRSVSRMIYGMI